MANFLVVSSQPNSNRPPTPFFQYTITIMDKVILNQRVLAITFYADTTIEQFIVLDDAVSCLLIDVNCSQLPHDGESSGIFRQLCYRVMEIKVFNHDITSLDPYAISKIGIFLIEDRICKSGCGQLAVPVVRESNII